MTKGCPFRAYDSAGTRTIASRSSDRDVCHDGGGRAIDLVWGPSAQGRYCATTTRRSHDGFRRDHVDVVDDDVSVRDPPAVRRRGNRHATIIFGAFTLAETGFDPDHLRRPHESIATVHHAPLLALMEIGFGVTCSWRPSGTFFGRMLMAAASVAALGFGLVLSPTWGPSD